MKPRAKILYIDDEIDAEKFGSKIDLLTAAGIEVVPIASAKGAWGALEEFHREIDLIVLDCIMPPDHYYSLEETNGGTTTGIRLLEDIRDKYPKIPVIIVSIRKKKLAEGDLRRLNVSLYLEKPITTEELARAIKDAITTP